MFKLLNVKLDVCPLQNGDWPPWDICPWHSGGWGEWDICPIKHTSHFAGKRPW